MGDCAIRRDFHEHDAVEYRGVDVLYRHGGHECGVGVLVEVLRTTGAARARVCGVAVVAETGAIIWGQEIIGVERGEREKKGKKEGNIGKKKWKKGLKKSLYEKNLEKQRKLPKRVLWFVLLKSSGFVDWLFRCCNQTKKRSCVF